jgi:hypothetical protein
MPVPVAAVYKDHRPVLREDEVWFAWKVLAVEPKSQAFSMSYAADYELWRCVL